MEQQRGIRGGIGASLPHDSAALNVTGRAAYTDDLPEPRGTLHAAIGLSARAHARVVALDLEPVRRAPGVVAVMTAGDVPGVNDCAPLLNDDPIFADGLVQYAGQSLFAVAARSLRAARRAVRLARVTYAELPALITADEAAAAGSFVLPTETLRRGDAQAALASAPLRLAGHVPVGGQDHFYLEGQVAFALPKSDGDMLVYSSTQHPSEVQHLVARALGKSSKDVVIECRRMGGGFGGKETQPALFACVAALLAARTGKPVKLRLDRDVDMQMTGKRHDFSIDYDVGYTPEGRILGVQLRYASRCGMSADLSGAVNDRAMFHSDNAYYLENVEIVSQRCKTNTPSNTAFRGFGGPQGMFAIEYVIDEVARQLGRDPLELRRLNLYGRHERNVTPYHQTIEDNILPELLDELARDADYHARRAQIAAFNRDSRWKKRGLALTPVKFGISFTATHLNQAGALLHIYNDGSVLLNHGGTEMGQGLYIKVLQVVAEELQIDVDRIRASAADTSKVPNTSATAASAGSDLNGKAAQAAARTIKQRLIAFAAQHFGVPEAEVSFAENHVFVGTQRLRFEELVKLAYMARVSLSATGYYRTPKIHYDRKTFSGRPFYYFAYGAAVSEVIVDVLTGEHRVLRVDILHDCGRSLNPAIDLGQIEGGFVQGMGWLTTEELWWNRAGELKTHAPSTYKIPVCSDVPADFRVRLFERDNVEDAIGRSKAVGEPPLMLALSVFHALKDAVASVAPPGQRVPLHAPATPEAVLAALTALQREQADAAERGEE